MSPIGAICAATVNRRRAGEDVGLQPFSQNTSLPIPLYKTCPVVIGNTIYMPCGETDQSHQVIQGDPSVNIVYYATPNPDGSISSSPGWQRATDLPHVDAARGVANVNTKGIVLMDGDSCGTGCDWNTLYKGVVTSTSNIAWSTLPSLPGTIGKTSRNAGATLNHYAYTVAGLYQGADSNAVRCLLLP